MPGWDRSRRTESVLVPDGCKLYVYGIMAHSRTVQVSRVEGHLVNFGICLRTSYIDANNQRARRLRLFGCHVMRSQATEAKAFYAVSLLPKAYTGLSTRYMGLSMQKACASSRLVDGSFQVEQPSRTVGDSSAWAFGSTSKVWRDSQRRYPMLSRLSVVSTRYGVSLLFPACTPASSMNSFSFRSCDKGPWSLELRDPGLLALEASTTFGYQVGSDQNATTLSRTPTFWINNAYLRA